LLCFLASRLRLNAVTLTFTIATIAFLLTALACVVAFPVMLNQLPTPGIMGWLLNIARWPVLLVLVAVGLTLIPQNKVLEQCGPAGSRLERILVIGDDHTLVCGHQRASGRRPLMQLAAGAGYAGLLDLRNGGFVAGHLNSPDD